MTFNERKAERTKHYFEHVYGWKLKECSACSGRGTYKNGECGACEGTGRSRYKDTDSILRRRMRAQYHDLLKGLLAHAILENSKGDNHNVSWLVGDKVFKFMDKLPYLPIPTIWISGLGAITLYWETENAVVSFYFYERSCGYSVVGDLNDSDITMFLTVEKLLASNAIDELIKEAS